MDNRIVEALAAMRDSVWEQLPALVVGTLVFFFFLMLGVFLRSQLRSRLSSRIDDELLVNFIGRVIFLVMLIIGFTAFLNQVGLGKAAGSLLAGAGVSAIIIGFAFKDIGENLLAGFFLAFSRPFGIGDMIELEGYKGTVRSLNFRYTHIRTQDGKDIFVPNGMLIKNPLINYTRDGLLRYDFTLGLDYNDNTLEAIRLIMSVLDAEQRIEHEGDLAPFVLLEEFATSTVTVRVHYWLNSFATGEPIATLRTGVMHSVLSALQTNGYTLPADIIEIKTLPQTSAPLDQHQTMPG